MRILSWIRSHFELAPINRVASVTCDDECINFQWRRKAASLAWQDIDRVLIRTTDQGPFDDDVFIVVKSIDQSMVISQSAPGASELFERLQQLQGFDNVTAVQAMGCTDNNEFLCWQR